MGKAPRIRLFVDAPLSQQQDVVCDKLQVNYLLNVMRLGSGAEIAVFNGSDGEWAARLVVAGKRAVNLVPFEMLKPQVSGPDLHYLFAPLKRARLDYMVQKAVEMGAARLRPVITQHCQVKGVNLERMRANGIEAAEQCGLLTIPQIDEVIGLTHLIDGWDESRHMVFCDEGADLSNPLATLRGIESDSMAVLIGPEGGFSEDERRLLRAQSFVTPLALGPRIMRADTAAVAALSLVNAVLGDWR